MANLLFKKGNYNSNMFGKDKRVGDAILNFAEGTVYITQDEQAMYVDTLVTRTKEGKSVQQKERIRLQGTVQYFESLKSWQDSVAPPYSTDVIYYIADKDALMKYGANGKWIQLNATAASVQDAVSTLQGLIAGNADLIAANADAISVLEGEMDNAEGRLDAIEKAIGTDADATGSILERLETAEQNIASNDKDIASLDGRVDTLEAFVTEHESNIEDISSIRDRVTQAEKDIASNDKDIANLQAKDNALDKDIAGINTKINNINTEIGNIKLTDDEQTESISANSESIDNLVKLVGAANLTAGGGKTVISRVTANEESIAGLRTNIGTYDNNKGNIATRLDNIEGDIGEYKGSKTIAQDLAAVILQAQETSNNLGDFQETVESTYATKVALQDETKARTDADTILTNNLNKTTQTLTTLKGDYETVKANLTSRMTEVEELAANTSDAFTAFKNNDFATLKNRVGTAEGNITNLQGRVTTLETWKTTASGQISDLQGRMNAEEATTEEFEERISANEDKLAGISTTVVDAIDAVETSLEDKINDEIRAVNAMQYKNGVTKKSELPTTGVKIGWTYVATSNFALDDNTDVYAGDLLVATGTEDETTGVLTSVSWDHVKTGYLHTQAPVLSTNNNSEIVLTSLGGEGAEGDLGKIKVQVSENLSLSISNNTISISQVWGTWS